MKLLITCLLLFTTSRVSAQFNENKGHIWLATGFGHVDSANIQTYGVRGEWLVHKYIGINYNFEVLHRNDNIWQVHSSAGLFVGPPLAAFGLLSLLATKNGGGTNATYGLVGLSAVVGLVMLVLPDGISAHIPIGHRWDLSPYANVFGADLVAKNHIVYLRYASSFGLKTTFWNISGLTFNAFTETRRVSHMGWCYSAGFGVGYAFGNTALKPPKVRRI